MKRACILLSVLSLASGCSHGLSHEQAQQLIESNALVRPAEDHVVVDAVSMSSQTEAIVRATIAGQTSNLKFRKFDTGWAWEFMETRNGGWIAPDVGVGQIRETNRQRRIVEWVTKNQDAYQRTIEGLDGYSDGLPNRIDTPFTVTEWRRMRMFLGEIELRSIEDSQRHPEGYEPDAITPLAIERRRRRAQARMAPTASDAWGSEFLINFDFSEHQAVFLSVGPDKQKATDDDVMCVAKGRKEAFEGGIGGLRWAYDKSWVLPEGLDAVVAPHFTKTFGSVQYRKLLR
jgi:hypothetical protein